jgi:hypothetical protein
LARPEGAAARAKCTPVAEIRKSPACAESAPVTEVSKPPACPKGAGIPSVRERGIAGAERSCVASIAECAHVAAVAERRGRGPGSRAEGAEPSAITGRAERRSDAGLYEPPGSETIADILLLVGESASLDGERMWCHTRVLDGALGRRFFVLGLGDCAAGNDGTDAEQADDEQNSRIPPPGAHGVFLESRDRDKVPPTIRLNLDFNDSATADRPFRRALYLFGPSFSDEADPTSALGTIADRVQLP